MPHFHIEYSSNLESVVDVAALCEVVRATAEAIDTFPMPGIRVRAIKVDHCAIADGDARHAFVDLIIRLREGRSEEIKKDALAQVFDAMKGFLEPAMKENSIAISAEILDISDELSAKTGTIRDHLGSGK